MRVKYIFRYFALSTEVSDKYPGTIFYLRILVISNILITAFAALIFLGLLLLCLLKCWETIYRRRGGQAGIFMNFAERMVGSLGAQQDVNVINYIIANMHKTQFKPLVHLHTKECPICLLEFTEGVSIIELPCDQRHYFHSECIQTWIQGQHRVSCPLCKKDIGEELNKKNEERKEMDINPLPESKNEQVIIDMGPVI